MSLMYMPTRTASTSEPPAARATASRFESTCLTCSATVVPTRAPEASKGPCPARNRKPPATIPCEYPPEGGGASDERTEARAISGFLLFPVARKPVVVVQPFVLRRAELGGHAADVGAPVPDRDRVAAERARVAVRLQVRDLAPHPPAHLSRPPARVRRRRAPPPR